MTSNYEVSKSDFSGLPDIIFEILQVYCLNTDTANVQFFELLKTCLYTLTVSRSNTFRYKVSIFTTMHFRIANQ
jgi:hypothetical protein